MFLVAREGRVVGEWYWHGERPGSAQEVFSVTKSITSTLVGHRPGRRRPLRSRTPASTLDPGVAGAPTSADVTVRNLLSNDSGRYWTRPATTAP